MAPSNTGEKRHPGKAILSGGISGGIEICITYPTEYVKTQLQLHSKGANGVGFSGPLDVVKKTVQQKGFFGLYRGLSPLLYFSIPKSAIRFTAFEMFKNNLQNDEGELSRGQTLLCGLGAGVSEAILAVTPMETIKVKFIHDQVSANPKYRGFFHGVGSIVKEQGLAGTYRGLMPTIAKQGSNQAIRFFVYGEITGYMRGEDKKRKLAVWETATAGMFAGAASVFGNTPIDVVKTRMQGLESHKYKGAIDCVKQIAQKEGFAAFYKGTTPRLGRVCADVAIVFTLYEQIMRGLDYIWPTK